MALFKEQREAKQGEGWRRLAQVGAAWQRLAKVSEGWRKKAGEAKIDEFNYGNWKKQYS